jgi:hypothetical protein
MAKRKATNQFEKVQFCEDIVSVFGFVDIKRRPEDGSREGQGYNKLAYPKEYF